MAKVIVGKLRGAGAYASRPNGTAASKSGAGRRTDRVILTVGGDIDAFGAEFTRIFSRNVAKARRENKRVTGNVDRIPAKV